MACALLLVYRAMLTHMISIQVISMSRELKSPTQNIATSPIVDGVWCAACICVYKTNIQLGCKEASSPLLGVLYRLLLLPLLSPKRAPPIGCR